LDAEFTPTLVTVIDIAQPLPRLERTKSASGLHYGSVRALVRLVREPVGVVTVRIPKEGVEASDLAQHIWASLSERIRQKVESRNGRCVEAIPVGGITPEIEGSHLHEPEVALGAAPMASVIVCTRDRAEDLRRCLLAVKQQKYPFFEVIVVDNAPTSDEAASVVSELGGSVPIRRLVEPIPGLARARNRGVWEARGSILAFIDDDEVPDEYWLAELIRGFTVADSVGCVTGYVMPGALETPAQQLFEEYGGHSKNRGFDYMVFDASGGGGQHPLYPLPPFGAGANMAFARQALIDVGGFDPALGAGTPTRAGEDTAAFSDVMLGGYRLVYHPASLVWHFHRAGLDELASQLFGYGTGLTSYFVRTLWRSPGTVVDLLGLAPRGVRDMLAPSSQRFATMTRRFPRDLQAAHRRGMLWGLAAYPYTLWKQRLVP
jgi:O-antigen biosynthesis protein